MSKIFAFNKQIVLAIGMIVFVVAALIGGTGAFFSDQTASVGNTFTAGSVSLTIENLTHDYMSDEVEDVPGANAPTFTTEGFTFDLDDIKPLDEGTITYELENGANQAHICVLVEDSTPTPDASDSALASMLNFLFETESGLISAIAGQWQSLGTLDAAQAADLSVEYCFGAFDGEDCELEDIDYNPAQNGQMVVDVEFYAVQTRNNPDFDCDSLNVAEPEVVYGNGFEVDLENWEGNGGTIERVPSGTNSVTSSGGSFHSILNDGAFTRLGGYSSVFPVGGFTTEVDVYLDMASALPGSDTHFDLSTAINSVANVHVRDFIFNVGHDTAGGQWLVAASNNADVNPTQANPSKNPVAVTETGWYTFQTYFYDNAGVLAVDLNLLDSDGDLIESWTLSTPTDLIGAPVGGNRYMWFAQNFFVDLPIDNAEMYLGAPIN